MKVKHFVIWLLTKWYRTVFAWPIEFNAFYREKLKYEPVFYTVISCFIVACVVIVVGMLGASVEGRQLTIQAGADYTIQAIVYGFVGYYVYTMIAIQYAKYCRELEDTLSVLGRKEKDNWDF